MLFVIIFHLFCIDFKHVEFTLGGDAVLPIRVLLSIPISNPDPDSSDEEPESEEVLEMMDHHIRFFDLVMGPALKKLPNGSLSKLKGAGSSFSKKWHIHPSDWARVSFNVDRLLSENNLNGQYL